MAKGVTIIDNLYKFTDGWMKSMDRALNSMAVDIERQAKVQVPFKKGQLKASGSHRKIAFMVYHTIFNKEYAAYQEFGGDGTRVVRHYSYPGKKKFYLKDPGDAVAEKAVDYFKREAGKIHI